MSWSQPLGLLSRDWNVCSSLDGGGKGSFLVPGAGVGLGTRIPRLRLEAVHGSIPSAPSPGQAFGTSTALKSCSFQGVGNPQPWMREGKRGGGGKEGLIKTRDAGSSAKRRGWDHVAASRAPHPFPRQELAERSKKGRNCKLGLMPEPGEGCLGNGKP